LTTNFLIFLPNYHSFIFIDLTVYVSNLRCGLYMFDNFFAIVYILYLFSIIFIQLRKTKSKRSVNQFLR